MLERVWRKTNLPALLVGMSVGQPPWRTVRRLLEMQNTELPRDPAVPLLERQRYISAKKTTIQKDACTPRFITALFPVAKTWKQAKCPLIDEWIQNMWHVHRTEYYSAKKNETILSAAAWMGLWIITLSRVSQERQTYHTPLVCGI